VTTAVDARETRRRVATQEKFALLAVAAAGGVAAGAVKTKIPSPSA
jgi:hypothetical protein